MRWAARYCSLCALIHRALRAACVESADVTGIGVEMLRFRMLRDVTEGLEMLRDMLRSCGDVTLSGSGDVTEAE